MYEFIIDQVTLIFYFRGSLSPLTTSNLKKYFSTRSAHIPQLFFDSPFMLRQLQQPVLADALQTELTQEANMQPEGRVHAGGRCFSIPQSSMAIRVSDLQGSVRPALYLHAKEIRKSDSSVSRVRRNVKYPKPLQSLPKTNTTVLVGDDRDLLVLLCFFEDGCNPYCRP